MEKNPLDDAFGTIDSLRARTTGLPPLQVVEDSAIIQANIQGVNLAEVYDIRDQTPEEIAAKVNTIANEKSKW